MAISPTQIAEVRLVRRLRQVNAYTSADAQALPGLPRLEEQALRELLSRTIIVEPSRGRYYLDQAAYARLQRHRRRLAFGIVAASLIIAVAAWVLTGALRS